MGARLDQILRLGCSVEAADVYDAVARLCECPSPSRRLELIADLERAYAACEAAHADAETAIEDFKQADGTPSTKRYSWNPG